MSDKRKLDSSWFVVFACFLMSFFFLGFALAANGVGSAVATQVVSPIIYREGDPFGYRQAYWLMAGVLVLVALLVIPLLREAPADGPVTQNKSKSGRSRDWPGMDYAQVKKKPYFYLAVVCIFLTGMCLQGLSGISAAHMRDVGLDPDAFGTYVPVILFYCGTMLTITVVFQFILNAAYRERKRIMSVEVTQ